MHLAQINIAEMLEPEGHPSMSGFFDNIDMINAIAEESPGFVWRLQDETGSATSIKAFDNDMLIINMSVWETRESIFDFVYKSMHLEIFKRKNEWFHKMKKMHYALWYIDEGHQPDLAEARKMLDHLNLHGETPMAFSFKKSFSEKEYIDYL
jgi:hypothetical protein